MQSWNFLAETGNIKVKYMLAYLKITGCLTVWVSYIPSLLLHMILKNGKLANTKRDSSYRFYLHLLLKRVQ